MPSYLLRYMTGKRIFYVLVLLAFQFSHDRIWREALDSTLRSGTGEGSAFRPPLPRLHILLPIKSNKRNRKGLTQQLRSWSSEVRFDRFVVLLTRRKICNALSYHLPLTQTATGRRALVTRQTSPQTTLFIIRGKYFH